MHALPTLARLAVPVIFGAATLLARAQGPALVDTPPPPPQTSVAEIRTAPTPGREIRLRGQLVRDLGDGLHLFSDPSGTIPVDVNHTVLTVDREVRGPLPVEVVGELDGPADAPPTVRARSLTVVAPPDAAQPPAVRDLPAGGNSP
ncbi:NirD/YgiW/YdeI family stress tolerance protein [Caldimonas thermodepolymerans]|jgi:uncharacterized protein YdeI (BOF family)|uniref:Uncharacterized protein YdeI (BOF family) n=1 Tax=Caldimonas thermodepolymerans TaxID=215580 RepID=A0AA46DC01_9BURK|nr:NirD/YgiW/YdeI family stress tolerance protein [Caldimonas thermodepolymerans]TCP03278.1 uncharacterized protein YdeI (BOF family) [Caldimonas thermodepolymerans]UZG47970.1 NirD/YgiW/YdeI family stress tolerance protein [Caldimonas thermodepolymerans]